MTNNKKLLSDPGVVKTIAERLTQIPEVSKFNTYDEKEAGALAHSFSDLEESFRKFLEEYFPRLKDKNLTNAEISDLLLDIGEEFRHILYHINSLRFYSYLRSDNSDSNDADTP